VNTDKTKKVIRNHGFSVSVIMLSYIILQFGKSDRVYVLLTLWYFKSFWSSFALCSFWEYSFYLPVELCIRWRQKQYLSFWNSAVA